MSGGVSGLQNLKMIASVVLNKVETQPTNTDEASNNEPLFDYSDLKLGQNEDDTITEEYAILAMNGFARGNDYQVEGYDGSDLGIHRKENDDGSVEFYVNPNDWNNSSDTNRCLWDIVQNCYNIDDLAESAGVSPQYMMGFLQHAVVNANGMNSLGAGFPKGEDGSYLPLKLPTIDEMVEMVGEISNSSSIKEINIDKYYENVVGMTRAELEAEANEINNTPVVENEPVASETPVEQSTAPAEQPTEEAVVEDDEVSIEEMEVALAQLANSKGENVCLDEIYEDYNNFCENLDAATSHNHTYNEEQSEYIQNLYNKLEGYNQIFAEMDNLNLSDDIKEKYKNNPDIMQDLYDLKSKNNDGQELSYSDLAYVIYENSSPFTQYENLYPIFNAMLEDSPYAEGLASENPQEYFRDFTNFGIEADRFTQLKEAYGYTYYEPANPTKAKEFIKDIAQNNDLTENEKAFFMMYVSNGDPQSLIHNFVNINGLLYTENFEKDNIGALFDLYSGSIQNASNTVSSTETTAETETTESNSNEVSSELTASDGSLVSDKSTEYIDKITSNDMTWEDFITELETNESEEVQGAIVEQIWRQIQNIDDSMLTDELRVLKYNVDLDG